MSDYMREENASEFLLPDAVKSWFTQMFTNMLASNAYEMGVLYDNEFSVLSSHYFSQSAWPEPETVSALVDHDPHFLTMYKQLSIKYLFSKIQPNMSQRLESWQNYCSIFDGLLSGELEVDTLPPQWAFDVVAEFVYQYQSHCQYGAKLALKSDNEVAHFRELESMWNTKTVLTYLQSLVDNSNILDYLKSDVNELEAIEKNSTQALRFLGYFSLVSLSRAHILFGDYQTALKILEPALSSKKCLYNKSPACHISLFYHLGFAQMMMRRYSDAIRSFSDIILNIARNKQVYSRITHYDQIMKWNDKSIALLTIVVALCPGHRLDDQVRSVIFEKNNDKFIRMQSGEIEPFEELFAYASPKFIIPSAPRFDDLVNRSEESSERQMKLFKQAIQQNIDLSTLRSYLKLYRCVELDKLARFQDLDKEQIISQLLSFKQNNQQLEQRDGGTFNLGATTSSSDVHFYIKNDLVFVNDQVNEPQYGDHFINHIHKLVEVSKTIG